MTNSGESVEFTTVFDAKSGVIEVTARLVIKNLVEVMRGLEVGKYIESDTFKVGETPMSIRVYVNGHVEEFKGWIGILLANKSNADIKVKCQFITDVQTSGFGYEQAVKPGQSRGSPKMVSHDYCAVAYKDKDFVVTAKVEIPGEPVKIVGIESVPAQTEKLNIFETVYNNMEDSDFALVFAGEEVPCHKHILSAASPVFKAMVRNKHKEAIEGKANIEFPPEVGRALVQFIYTGKMQEGLLEEQPAAFLAMGEMFDLQELKDLAEREQLIQLDRDNMVAMISLGELFRADKIFEAALKLTKVNMSWLRTQVEDRI